MDAAWFDRTWTIQEVVLAKKADVLIGHHRISWSLIERAWTKWVEHMKKCCGECISTLSLQDFQTLSRFASRTIDLNSARLGLESGQGLIQNLLKFRSRQATDPLDKIYGVMGLQSGFAPIVLHPNYSLSQQELFVEFAPEMIRSQGWLAPLHLDLSKRLMGLPSWVPDWTHYNDDPGDYAVDRFNSLLAFGASNRTESSPCVQLGNILEVEGVEIDCVRSVSSAYRLTKTSAEQIHLVMTWRMFKNLDKRTDEAYVCGGTLGDAFLSSMFENKFRDVDGWRRLRPEDTQEWLAQLEDTPKRLANEGPRATIGLTPVMSSHFIAVLRRRLFFSPQGYIGICPESVELGDRIFLLRGCYAPIFLRPVNMSTEGNGNAYKALGHGYVHNVEAAVKGLLKRQILIV